MLSDLSKIRRYELKYAINENIAAKIRDYLKGYFSLDKHVPPGKDGYIVNNLYFDTPDLRFYYDTKHRKLTRYKLRARFYGEKAIDYIWPEIKYRCSSVIWKTRYRIPVEQWPELFYPQKSEQVKPVIKNCPDSFEELIHCYGALPILHVRYFREPYVTELEEYGRVTFDRRLSYRMAHGSINLSPDDEDMLFYDDPVTSKHFESPVLLEIKVEMLVPFWAIDIIRKFNLVQRPFSKYCYGIDNNIGYLPDVRSSIFNMEFRSI
jgi:hypothetical protein